MASQNYAELHRTTPIRQSGRICQLLFGIRVIYAMLPPHGHCRNIKKTANLYFYLYCVNISLILNSVYNTALFDKKVSLFNLYVIRVGLDNAATSWILINPAVILIL